MVNYNYLIYKYKYVICIKFYVLSDTSFPMSYYNSVALTGEYSILVSKYVLYLYILVVYKCIESVMSMC